MSVLEWIVYLFDLLPIVVFLFLLALNKRIAKQLWVILFFNICSLLNNTIVIYYGNHNLDYSLFLHIFTIVEYSCFAVFIYNVIQNRFAKKFLLVCSSL